MRLDLDNLPADTTLLQQLVRDLADMVERQKTELAELEQLKLLLRQMKRTMFGRRSERLDPDQMQLALEDLEADIARAEEKVAPAAPEPATDPEAPARRRDPPDHLPHRDLTIEPADISQDRAVCPCCGGALHGAGETVSKMLDYVPAQIRVLRIRRPKYACRGCGALHQAPAPEKAIAKGMATPALLAHVIVSRYGDHVPFYRQSQILARHGVEIDRSVLAGWAGRACWWLEMLHDELAREVFASTKLFADGPLGNAEGGRRRCRRSTPGPAG